MEFADAIAHSDRLKSIEGIPVRQLTEPEREPVHLWIDFSRPEGTMELLKNLDTPIVVGTTGFSGAQFTELEHYSKTRAVLYAPNMAPGMNALMQLLRHGGLSPQLGFNVVANETHHVHKKDAPSGTMKRLIDILNAQGHKNIQVQVARAGEVFGIHSLRFISGEEEITIEHRVSDRKVFAKGALLAASFLLKGEKKPGLYSYEDVLRPIPAPSVVG